MIGTRYLPIKIEVTLQHNCLHISGQTQITYIPLFIMFVLLYCIPVLCVLYIALYYTFYKQTNNQQFNFALQFASIDTHYAYVQNSINQSNNKQATWLSSAYQLSYYNNRLYLSIYPLHAAHLSYITHNRTYFYKFYHICLFYVLNNLSNFNLFKMQTLKRKHQLFYNYRFIDGAHYQFSIQHLNKPCQLKLLHAARLSELNFHKINKNFETFLS
jgi:hypothetical protein